MCSVKCTVVALSIGRFPRFVQLLVLHKILSGLKSPAIPNAAPNGHVPAIVTSLHCITSVASLLAMWHWGTCPLEFWKFCAFWSCCQLSCENFENYQRKTCITFCLSFHTKTHV